MIFALQAAEDASREWRLIDVPETWILVLVVLPLIAGVSFLGYRSEPISTVWKATLGCLRFAAIALLCLVLFRPMVVEREEEVRPAEVIILLDDSASMSRVDSYADEATREGLAPFAPNGIAIATRVDLARNATTTRLLPALKSKGYQARVMRFDATATAMAGDDRRQYGAARLQARDHIGNGNAYLHGRAFLGPGNRHQPAHSLDDQVVPRPFLLAKGGDRAMDDTRVGGGDRLSAQPQAVGDSGSEVLDQHVRASHHVQEEIAPGPAAQIQTDRPLTPVDGEKVGAEAQVSLSQIRRPPGACVVTARWPLDLYDGRPQIGQEHAAVGASQDARQVENGEPVQSGRAGRALV